MTTCFYTFNKDIIAYLSPCLVQPTLIRLYKFVMETMAGNNSLAIPSLTDRPLSTPPISLTGGTFRRFDNKKSRI